jgi:hypothetical protein
MTTSAAEWAKLILTNSSSEDTWTNILQELLKVADNTASPQIINSLTNVPDRLLAEAGWGLWADYQQYAPRTSQVLRQWWNETVTEGRAILVLDALSLRELPFIVGGAESHGVSTSVRITGSELPSDTDTFARALGASSRSQLENDGKAAGFAFSGQDTWTDVVREPFEDCAGFPPRQNVFLWHTWLDDQIHQHGNSIEQISKLSEQRFQSEGFWKLIDALRTGRRLVVTSDHGYAVASSFSTDIKDPDHVKILRDKFGASRSRQATEDLALPFLPPLTVRCGTHLVITGQRKWRVQGGVNYCHGGASLLEVGVPFIEFPAKAST